MWQSLTIHALKPDSSKRLCRGRGQSLSLPVLQQSPNVPNLHTRDPQTLPSAYPHQKTDLIQEVTRVALSRVSLKTGRTRNYRISGGISWGWFPNPMLQTAEIDHGPASRLHWFFALKFGPGLQAKSFKSCLISLNGFETKKTCLSRIISSHVIRFRFLWIFTQHLLPKYAVQPQGDTCWQPSDNRPLPTKGNIAMGKCHSADAKLFW